MQYLEFFNTPMAQAESELFYKKVFLYPNLSIDMIK